jgi:hypothetical protein
VIGHSRHDGQGTLTTGHIAFLNQRVGEIHFTSSTVDARQSSSPRRPIKVG